MSLEIASSHLAELGYRIGTDLAFDADGVCPIAYGEDQQHTVVLHYVSATEILLAVCPVSDVPEDADPSYCHDILRFNVQSLARFNGSLALNSEGSAIVFIARFSLQDSTSGQFIAFMESFLEGIEEFKDLFSEYSAEMDADEEEHQQEGDEAQDEVPEFEPWTAIRV